MGVVNSDLKTWKNTDIEPSKKQQHTPMDLWTSCFLLLGDKAFSPSLLQPLLSARRQAGIEKPVFLYPEDSSSPVTKPEGHCCCQTSKQLNDFCAWKTSLKTKQLLRILKIAGQNLLQQLGGRRRQWHLLKGISVTQKAKRKQTFSLWRSLQH